MRVLVILTIGVVGVMSFLVALDRQEGREYAIRRCEATRPDKTTDFVAWVLVKYARSHRGMLPKSWDDLISEGLVEQIPGDHVGIRIPHIDLPDEPYIDSWTIYDRGDFVISFGLGPDDVDIRKEMEGEYTKERVYGPDGEPLLIVRPVTPNWEEYRHMYNSVALAEAMKEAADGQGGQ